VEPQVLRGRLQQTPVSERELNLLAQRLERLVRESS
jgi:hypothetical protein